MTLFHKYSEPIYQNSWRMSTDAVIENGRQKYKRLGVTYIFDLVQCIFSHIRIQYSLMGIHRFFFLKTKRRIKKCKTIIVLTA